MRVGLIVPGFSADAEDWCIPALRHLALRVSDPKRSADFYARVGTLGRTFVEIETEAFALPA